MPIDKSWTIDGTQGVLGCSAVGVDPYTGWAKQLWLFVDDEPLGPIATMTLGSEQADGTITHRITLQDGRTMEAMGSDPVRDTGMALAIGMRGRGTP